MILHFSDEDIIQGCNSADLGPDGDFTAERLEVDPEEWPNGWITVRGTWDRYDPEEGAVARVEAEMRFRLDLTRARAEALAKKRLDELSAGDIFTAPREAFYVYVIEDE